MFKVVFLTWSAPALAHFLSPSLSLLPPPLPLSPCGSLQWQHAVLIESDPDSSFFQTALADAPLFSPPPAVDNWPFGWGALRRELWPRCVGLSPFSLSLQTQNQVHAERQENCSLAPFLMILNDPRIDGKKLALVWLVHANTIKRGLQFEIQWRCISNPSSLEHVLQTLKDKSTNANLIYELQHRRHD